MPQLGYALNDGDLEMWEQMRRFDDPSLVVVEFMEKETKSFIAHKIKKADLEGGNALDLFKKWATTEGGEICYKNKSCIVAFIHPTKDKNSQMEKTIVSVFKWCPEGVKMREKMIYSSGWQTMQDNFQHKCRFNTNSMFEAADWDDVEDHVKTL